jgi:hypothetical protein
MDFFSFLVASFLLSTPSFSIGLFALSALLLIAGVALRARSQTRLVFLEHTPLNHIEFTHPHLPSMRAVRSIVLCVATLLLVGLKTFEGVFPFNDPYQGLNLVSLFLIGCSVGILAELKWKGASEYSSALLFGTALAFLFLILQSSLQSEPLTEVAILIALLVPSMTLAGSSFSRRHRRLSVLTMLLAFVSWILIYLIR